MSQQTEHFEHIALTEEPGIVDGTNFRHALEVHDIHCDATFVICTVHGSRVAVFFGVPLSDVRRAEITRARPDWIDAIVFAKVDAATAVPTAFIDADVTVRGNATATSLAFATAVVVENQGAFKFEPSAYVVRLGPETEVKVAMSFDWDTESWSGDAAVVAQE